MALNPPYAERNSPSEANYDIDALRIAEPYILRHHRRFQRVSQLESTHALTFGSDEHYLADLEGRLTQTRDGGIKAKIDLARHLGADLPEVTDQNIQELWRQAEAIIAQRQKHRRVSLDFRDSVRAFNTTWREWQTDVHRRANDSSAPWTPATIEAGLRDQRGGVNLYGIHPGRDSHVPLLSVGTVDHAPFLNDTLSALEIFPEFPWDQEPIVKSSFWRSSLPQANEDSRGGTAEARIAFPTEPPSSASLELGTVEVVFGGYPNSPDTAIMVLYDPLGIPYPPGDPRHNQAYDLRYKFLYATGLQIGVRSLTTERPTTAADFESRRAH